MISPLARVIPAPFTNEQRTGLIFGVAAHTTGSGLPAEAIAKGIDPWQAGIDYYRASKGPTYLVGWKKGQIAAVTADEMTRTWHIGIEANEAGPLADGTWRQMVSPETVRQWNERWGASRNPVPGHGPSLITGHPNNVLIGVESIPCTSDGRHFWAEPMRPGLRFTRDQHDMLRELFADIARRWSFPSGWQRTRLFGHEDINPIRRSDAGGGWDPGRLRASPYIDLDYIAGGSLGLLAVALVVTAGVLYLTRR